MIGPLGVTSLLATRVAARWPAKAAELRARLTLTQVQFPDITAAYPTQAPRNLGIEAWPLVEIVNVRDSTWVQADDAGDGKSWSITYSVDVYVWFRGDDQDDTARGRQLMLLCLMEIVAELFQLDERCRIVSASADYSDLVRASETRSIAGARMHVDIAVAESLTVGYPIVGSVTVDTTLIPRPAA